MELTVVEFAWEGDGQTAVYNSDGQLYISGDYHDSIDVWLEGFKEGCEQAGSSVTIITKYVNAEDFDYDCSPSTLKEVYKNYKVRDKAE